MKSKIHASKKTLLLFLTLLLCAPAYAQGNDSLFVLFLSQPGMLPARVQGGTFGSQGDLARASRDANGDGTPDLILQRDDAQGNLQALRVLDGRTRAVLWEVPDVAALVVPFVDSATHTRFYHYADPSASGTAHALFIARDESGADVGVVLIDPRDNSLAFRTLAPLIGATDLTGDGFEELITFLPDTEQVQVWSIDN